MSSETKSCFEELALIVDAHYVTDDLLKHNLQSPLSSFPASARSSLSESVVCVSQNQDRTTDCNASTCALSTTADSAHHMNTTHMYDSQMDHTEAFRDHNQRILADSPDAEDPQMDHYTPEPLEIPLKRVGNELNQLRVSSADVLKTPPSHSRAVPQARGSTTLASLRSSLGSSPNTASAPTSTTSASAASAQSSTRSISRRGGNNNGASAGVALTPSHDPKSIVAVSDFPSELSLPLLDTASSTHSHDVDLDG